MSHVSSHPVLSHQGDDAGWGASLCQEGVFKDLAGCGPLSWVSHQHPVQKALEQRRDLKEGEKSSNWSGFQVSPRQINSDLKYNVVDVWTVILA